MYTGPVRILGYTNKMFNNVTGKWASWDPGRFISRKVNSICDLIRLHLQVHLP